MATGIGVNAWVWTSPFTTDEEGLALIDKVKKMGFDSFEFGLEDTSHVDPAKLKSRTQSNGLRLVICGAFGPDRDLTHDDQKVRDNSLNYITQTIKICQQSGCKTMAGPMYSAVGKRRHVSPATGCTTSTPARTTAARPARASTSTGTASPRR